MPPYQHADGRLNLTGLVLPAAAPNPQKQFTGVNATANFASLTDKTITNLPYDAAGNLVRPNGFGTINGVAPPRTLQLMTRISF